MLLPCRNSSEGARGAAPPLLPRCQGEGAGAEAWRRAPSALSRGDAGGGGARRLRLAGAGWEQARGSPALRRQSGGDTDRAAPRNRSPQSLNPPGTAAPMRFGPRMMPVSARGQAGDSPPPRREGRGSAQGRGVGRQPGWRGPTSAGGSSALRAGLPTPRSAVPPLPTVVGRRGRSSPPPASAALLETCASQTGRPPQVGSQHPPMGLGATNRAVLRKSLGSGRGSLGKSDVFYSNLVSFSRPAQLVGKSPEACTEEFFSNCLS